MSSLREEELSAIPGIGKDLAGKIRQVAETGRVDLYEELKKEIPDGLLAILRVPGVGPKTAKLLYDKRNVKSLEELEGIYSALGLPWIAPELREDAGEIEAARKGKLPDLLTQDDILGDLHAHTKWSDGSHDLESLHPEPVCERHRPPDGKAHRGAGPV